MMALLPLLLVASITVATQATPTSTTFGLEENLLWEKFKLEHVKAYPQREEEEVRKDVFRANLRKIGAHNEREEQGLEDGGHPVCRSHWGGVQAGDAWRLCQDPSVL